MKNKFFTYKWIGMFLLGLALIAVYKTFDNLGFAVDSIFSFLGLLTPFAVGLFLAYLLYMPSKALEALFKKRVKFISRFARPISVSIVYLVAFAIVTLLLSFVLPVISQNIIGFGSMLNSYIQDLPGYVEDLLKTYPSLKDYIPNSEEFVNDITLSSITQNLNFGQLGRDLLQFLTGSIVGVASTLLTIFMGIIISVYMLLSRDMIHKGCVRLMHMLMRQSMVEQVSDYARKINKVFNSFIYGALLDAAIVGTIATIALSIIGAPFPPLSGLILMFANLIPYFGPIIGVLIIVLLTFLQSGYLTGIITFIVLLTLSQIDAHIMNPKIVGQSVGLKPLWIIFAITVGGGLFGFLGIVLSVPILAAIKILIVDLIDYVEKRRKHKKENGKPAKDLEL